MFNPDYIIVGSGIIGCSTALQLANTGASVRLLERNQPGQESSWAGGGILFPLLPWDYTDAVNQLVQRSIALFPGWAEELQTATGIDPEYRCCGMLVLPPVSTSKARIWCDTHGTRLESAGAREIVPELAADEEALWLPDVAQARNPRLLKALRRRLELLGVEISEHTEVTRWNSDGARITSIETSRGELKAGRYIVASGAWSKKLLGEHALNLDIRPIRGQMLLFKAEPGALRTIILREGFYLIPRLDGHILAGSTLEDVGFDKTTTEQAKAMLYAQATEILPLLKHAPVVKHWAGLRPGSPDNIPTIDRHPQLENLYINSGHFRYGVTMAPASAEIMANLILERPQTLDIAPYRWPVAQK
ncbi:putative D-amino acid oxidase [Sulfurimicrobium lacus]|uniref:Putative D-amino acid oxidase n=1 Tax=Sulfurimicrobium lacus TaxID=2715678 RepID=A0A6F8VBM9_9PROT|nr:glycine oxidase ThiO [Sulfurimicrobium lacus]BCB26372.1 putative D-amino acid oxidase [Sulfurimicrobium lacus]